ncbi:hypothetical protein GQ651_16375 [Alphaproteobacteria bacterium GH1-50]|uniref:Uncharacterized protein n=1 Tax=Kangsaoukella pontilimi TaxID=2691042 RepID=A0A7C9II35_9RHOB|nr:hypothetical protein [Kangsaoukella pontilimi]MXQ09424.1 hypothetical protein [Kangsaoukella pontilimi]
MTPETRPSAKTADTDTRWRALIGALAALGLILSVLSWNPLARVASAEARATLASTVTVYAGLRSLNAFLSTAQEVEVGGSLVVQGSVQPLKTLEPIDDTVERVAAVVLTLSVASGLLALGFGPLSVIGFAVMLAGVGLRQTSPDLARRCLATGALVALILPASFAVSGVAGDAMTRAVWAENTAILDRIRGEVGEDGPVGAAPAAAGGTGFWSWLTGDDTATEAARGETLGTVARYREVASVLWSESGALLESYVSILAVWLLKLVVLPLTLILVAVRLIR